jgi:hypothetical protein
VVSFFHKAPVVFGHKNSSCMCHAGAAFKRACVLAQEKLAVPWHWLLRAYPDPVHPDHVAASFLDVR